jgi:fucose 4-O-acetylase-like acetyltransferase
MALENASAKIIPEFSDHAGAASVFDRSLRAMNYSNTRSLRLFSITELAAPPARLRWLDAAKGIGMLLAIVGHASGGLIDEHLATEPGWLRTMFFFVYTFHMPLFFFLSGLLVANRVARGPKTFFIDIVRSLLWPYCLWSIIQFSIMTALGGLLNHPVDPYVKTILLIPINPIAQFWFIYALLLLHMLACVLVPRIGKQAFFLACLALTSLVDLHLIPVHSFAMTAHNAMFYGLGVLIGSARASDMIANRPAVIRALVLPGLMLAMFAASFFYGVGPDTRLAVKSAFDSAAVADIAWSTAFVALAVVGLTAVIALASVIGGPLGAFLVYVGQRTLPIYILHIMAIAGTRIVLGHVLHITSVNLVLPAICAAGLMLPLIAYKIARRLKLAPVLGLG